MSRRRGRHGRHEEEVENGERWLLTYADMITLLLALFIVLFSISTINQKKFLALALGIRQTFNPKPGVLPSSNGLLNNASLTQKAGSQLTLPSRRSSTNSSTTTTVGTQPPGAAVQTVSDASLEKLQQQINSALVAQGLSADVSQQQQTRGLVVQILADKVFFATGSADLGPVGNQVVDTVASVLKGYDYDVNVEGYTDNQPLVGGPFGSNEELSAVRAVNVVLRLENTDGLDPSRLSATGYGDTHPVAPNDNAADMSLNRRIDVVILSAPQSVQP